MPTQYLTQVVQTPNDRVIGDIPLKTLAGLELSRRAQMQNELAAMGAPNAQMPTVMDSTVQSLNPQPQQPQQPMPQQGMPPAPPPQQAAPQPQPQPQQPQQPPQPQQQQQPPQAKPNPIMGLPAMQGPKKMAGGGIIAFNGEKDSEVPKDEEKATSSIGDFFRRLMEPPEFLKGRIERAKDIDYAESQVPSPFTAVTPSERARRKEETARVLAGGKRPPETPVSDAVKEDAKKDEGRREIIRAPDRSSGLADLAKMGGGIGGGGGFGGPSREESALRKQLLEGLNKQGPAQTEYVENARRMANELETARSPALSEEQRDALEDKQYSKYQARSKPHFDMMQKLLDEERAANNAGKDSEFYQMLGKMGGTLMSSRGAFGPALGRAVGEGIDYSDKMDAARAAAERLRRSAEMDLLKARMADEKNDQKSAQEYINEHDRKIQAAFKIQQENKIGAMNIRGKMADLEAGDERSRERTLSQLSALDQKREISAANQQNAALRMQLGLAGLQQKREVSPMEKMKIKSAINEMFSNPFNDSDAIGYIQAVKGNRGANLLAKIKSGELKPKDAMLDPVMAEARQIAYSDFLSGTSKGGGGSGVQSYDSYVANLPK
jgi:hypothetical protein